MRTARALSEHDIYHCIHKGTGKQLIFEKDADYEHFLELLQSALAKEGVRLLAWCLMSNHTHLLLQAPMPSISRAMKRAAGSYAQWFNKKTGRTGHLFQSRFASEPVNDEAYLMTVVRYIHQNPAKALIARTDEYRWSSYKEYLGDKGISSTDLALEVFGGTEEYVAFHKIEGTEPCLEAFPIRSRTRTMPDNEALAIALTLLGRDGLLELKALPQAERNEGIRTLRDNSLSIRQIQRLTGIGRSVIARA